MRVMTITTATGKHYPTPICACIGYFDGVHRGHQKLIEETIQMAKEKQCESALITFDPDPWVTVRGDTDVKHICTMRQRMNLAVHLGIQNIIILKFTKDMSELSPKKFVENILGRLELKGLVCGFDFHYGHLGRGSGKSLQKTAPYDVKIVSEVKDAGGKISSTRISEALVNGKIEQVNDMLGYCYYMEGTVVHGLRQGTQMGFPTANVRYSDEYILPKLGVYAGFAVVGKSRYKAMINIGHNPTVAYTKKPSLEVHLLGYKGDLYERMIAVEFVSYLREERTFKNRSNLAMQMNQDMRDIKKILADYE